MSEHVIQTKREGRAKGGINPLISMILEQGGEDILILCTVEFFYYMHDSYLI